MRGRVFALVALLIGVCALGGVAGCGAAGSPVETYRGAYRLGFETQAFWTETGEGPYWVEGDKRLMDKLAEGVARANGGSPWGGVDVELRGQLSVEGKYGHQGAYRRRLKVRRVVKITPREEATRA